MRVRSVPLGSTRLLLPSAPLRSLLLCLLLALWLPGASAFAATAPLVERYREVWTTREGLPHNTVNAIAQTPDGYLWLGTWEGVARYSGLSFRNFDRNSGTQLPDSGVRALFVEPEGSLLVAGGRGGISRLRDGDWQALPPAPSLATEVLRDRNGRVWVGTENGGLMRIDSQGRRVHYAVDPDHGGGSVHDLLEDALGRIWVATSRGLMRVQDERLLPAPGADAELGRQRVNALALDARGHLLAGGDHGLFASTLPLLSAADPDLRFEPIEPALAGEPITRLRLDRSGDLWIGTIGRGLFRRSALGLEQLDVRDGLPNSRVLALFEDREGSLWIGTNGGLMRLGDAPFSSLTSRLGLSDDYVRALLEQPDGSLLVATSQGLNRAQGASAEPFPRSSGLASLSVLSLAHSRRGFWAGSYAEGALRVVDDRVVERIGGDQGLPSDEVRALFESADGSLWIGTPQGLARWHEGRVQVWSRADGLPGDYVVALHEDADGSLWVGTGTGMGRLRDDHVESIDLSAVDGVESVFSILDDPAHGVLWLATDRGLLRYRRSDGRVDGIGFNAGLPFEKFFHVLNDGLGSLWLSGNRGVLRISLDEAHAYAEGRRERAEFEHFSEADGMASAQCNGGSGPAALVRADGSLWFATAIGAAHVDPHRLDGFAQQAPPVVIESLLADSTPLALREPVRVPAGTSRIEIGFAGLAFVMPQRVRYRYRLEGFDSDWIERGEQRSAAFTNLDAGDYTLRVQASHPNGPWSEQEARLSFSLQPLWWQRPLSWVLLIGAMIGLTLELARRRLRRIQATERRLRELVEQRTADLSRQTARLIEADSEKNALLEQLRLQSEAFERQAREDALTGLGNRRAFDELLAYEFARAGRAEQPLCVALVDLDHFKRVNDEHSHAAGDAVLRAVAERMRELCREVDTVSRWGGEEFALLLPNTRLSDALQVCERVRAGLERLDLSAIAPGLRITASIGIASHEGHADYDRMLAQADAALYSAKQAGRNRVAC